MKPGFMSSVCPKQTLDELIATAHRYGYQGIEFRTEWDHAHGVELEASAAGRAQIRHKLEAAGIAASCIATSVRFNSTDPAEHEAQRASLRAYVELAAEVGAPYIRTFGDRLPEDAAERATVVEMAAASYASVDGWAREHGIEVLLETHSNMRGEWAAKILDAARAESLQVLWHIGHHLRYGQSVDEAYGYIRGHVRHVHFSVMPSEWVTDADNQRSFDLLAADGFEGYFSVEVIDPDDPISVLETHASKFREFLRNARRP